MKSFLEWFKAGAKVKRWLFLILIGIILMCYAFSVILNTDEFTFMDIAKTIVIFVVGFVLEVISVIFIQKRNLEIIIEANGLDGGKSNVNIKSLIFNKKVYENGPKIVIIGGGQGLNNVIEGFKKYTNNITAIVTMSDYGDRPSNSRQALDILPLKDIKDSIISMSDKEEIMKKLMNLNFKNERLEGLNFGDIYLTAMNEIYSNISEAILKSTEVLNITGRVMPITLDEITICAELGDGTTIKQKDRIPEIVSERIENINRIYITPSNCRPSPGVLEAIEDAEAIIIGPGSLYTNVLPNLLVKNVSKAIKDSKAIKYYIANIMTEPGQTDNYSLSDHLKAIDEHVGVDIIDYCLVDTGDIVPEYIRKYNKEGSDVVEVDLKAAEEYGVKLIKKDMSCIKDNRIRHDSDVISATIVEMICNDLKFKDMQNDTEYLLLNSVLKEQDKIRRKEEKVREKNKKKGIPEKSAKFIPSKKESKFKSKYRDRVESIQNLDETIAKNRKKMEKYEEERKAQRRKKIAEEKEAPKKRVAHKSTSEDEVVERVPSRKKEEPRVSAKRRVDEIIAKERQSERQMPSDDVMESIRKLNMNREKNNK